ncbi:hypothetical protein R3W88_034041 [Solanum pinnatisectum]|uniref:Uncharacterized protein n=1 Tax=Solanum pinnatisectum TaxID=50273 RepID=A0AAV9JZ86_9SOLN|nr:hypothetical protein R3W88_034041 [Solanum pinnatisectum]
MAGNIAYQLDPGPLESSVLTEQITHRSRDIWDGSVNMILNTRRCDGKFWDLVKKYPIPPRVLEVIQLSRLYGVYRSHRPMIDHSLRDGVLRHIHFTLGRVRQLSPCKM